MKRFGFAIRTGGDPEISGALAAGIEQASRDEVSSYVTDAVRRVAMMQHTPEEWEAMIVKARYEYGQDPPTPRWMERLLVTWALAWMGMRWLYHLQDRLLNRRTI